jgi:hypothetical protein
MGHEKFVQNVVLKTRREGNTSKTQDTKIIYVVQCAAEVGCEGTSWFHLAEVKTPWRVAVNTVDEVWATYSVVKQTKYK